MGKTLGYGEITVANMTEPFTVMLTNEAQQFATDSNRKVTSAQSYYTDIIVIRGSQERTDYTIGNITSGSGITVSKSSKRITFSVSAGTTIGADTGVIEIPITLDGQTVKKQFSWSCGKQGPQGVKGKDGTSIKITSKSVTYQTSTSGTTTPTGTWSTTVPMVNNGQYLWTKTTVQYSDGNKTEAYSVSYKGTNGTNGTSVTVSKTEVTYQVSTSGTTAPTGTWSTTMPSCDQGQYLWTKTYVKYSDGKETTSYSVSYKGVDGEKFAFNMLRETNQGSKHWENHASGGKYSTESIITEDGINAVKLICTEAIPSGGWQYVSFDDYQMLKSLKPSTDYVISFDIKSNLGTQGSWVSIQQGDSTNAMLPAAMTHIKGNETWEHIRVFLRSNDTLPKINGQYIYITSLGGVGYSIIKNLKLTESTTDTPWAPHPEDLEGRGVSETVQYYLATSQASGVTSSTSGWSTDITTQKLTADKKYLWNCYQTKYSDGTSEPISTPKVIGVYGDKGDNAKNLSITPSSQYFKSTDGGKTFAPNTITIKPTLQGEISFGKWQYSIDGGVSFVDVVSGQKGLTISNNVLTVSKDSSLYSDAVTMVTFRAVASDSSFYDTCSIAKIYDVSDIGDGRNLLLNTSSYRESNPLERTGLKTDDWSTYPKIITSIDLSVNQKYTLQAKTDSNWATKHDTGGHTPSEKLVGLWLVSDYTNTFLDMSKGYAVFTAPKTTKYKLRVNQYSDGTNSYTIRLWDIKLEKGQSASGWSAAPEDVQTAILSTKSEISDVSLKVDNNKQAIEQRVEKTTYQQDLKLVKGDISKANEGLNKWRYEIYPKSLFASEYQGKSTMDVFAKNTNLTPSQSVLINDTDFGKSFAYGDNYIGYALTFVKFSAAKSVAITFKHDDGAHLYLNGKLIGGDDTCNTGSGESLTLSFIQGWNCLEVVLNEKSGGEYIGLGTTISAISECQLMNCYYGTPVARQSHITNQLVQNTTDIDGVSGSVQKVMSTVGGSGKIDEFVSNYATWKKKVDGIETRVGETYTTKDDFDDLQIGGRNLLKHSSMIGEKLICDNYFICNNCNIQEYTNDGFHIITPTEGNANNGIAFAFDNFTIMEINGGDTITFSCDIKGTSDSHAPFVSIHISDNNWYGSGVVQKNTDVSITKDWQRVSVTITTPTGLTKNHMWLAIHGNHQSDLYVRNFKLEKGNKPTDWTPAPEDVNGKIVNVETIANQTANKFSWIVKSGTSASNFEITDKFMNLVSTNINLDGIVSFMNTAKGDGRKNLYNLDYSSFENVASQEDAICYAKDNGVTSVGIDSSVSYDGDKSLKISYTTANLNSSTTPLYLGSSANNYGCVKIQAGKQYILSCYVKSDSTTGLFMIDIQGHDTPDTKTDGLYLSNIDPRKLPGSSTGVNLSTDWQRAVCAIKVADNATGLYWSVVPLIWGKPSSSSAPKTFNIWVDCIMLEEVDSISNEPGTYILDKETIIDGGSVKADTITGNQILAGSITADKIATDAIKSRNYDSSGGTQGSFLNLGDGSFTSPNLSWDSNGNLIAKNANLSGEITATKGKIGKYTITDQWLITGSGSTASGFGGNQAFWAGSSSSNDAPFRVGYNGKLYANGATISGDITATTGKIGDLTLKDGILTGTGSYSEPYTEDDDGTVTSTITTNYITKLFGKGLTIDSTVKYSDEDDVYSYKVSVLPDEISFTDGEEIGMLGAGGLQILQVNDNSDSYSSEANEVSLSSGASNFYYTTPVNQTTDKYLHVCFSADGASFMASQGDKFNSFDIGYSSAKYSGNFAANKFVYTGNSLNYVECLEANDTTNIYFHSNGYYSFRVNNEGNWSNETQSVYITGRGISVPGQIGLYSQEMSNYVARYYIAGSTKSTAIGNNSYQTRIYGSSVWANKAVSTSDVRLKQDFQSLDKFEDLYMQLQPVSFKYIDGYDKSEDRYFGLKAQPTEKLFEDMGENPDDYAMFNKFGIDHEDIKERIGYDVDFDEEHGLDYTNLITLNTHMVQKTRRELAELQKENAELKDMLKTIVKKINM